MAHFSEKKFYSLSTVHVFHIALGIAMLFAGSQIQIPLRPVPITLQTLSVLLIGLTYTPYLTSVTMGTWIAMGAIGLPVFSGFSGGINVLIGPRGGYILGFFLAAWAMSLLQQKISLKSFYVDFFLCVIGTVIIYTFGLLWLGNFIGFTPAIQLGLLPFVLPGLVKSILLSGCLHTIRGYTKK